MTNTTRQPRVDLPETPIQRALSPFSEFIARESTGGLLLAFATLVAIAWANSPWAESYHAVWETPLSFALGPWEIRHSLHYWINDGLMAVFFFLVGLEIKRELLVGELASARRAALPAAAALGGMVVPALIYFALNRSGPGAHGWGIPMATDIAFALGVLVLLGSRAPLALKIFLTALAIVDDLGAVLVIALFYTAQIAWVPLLIGIALLVACAFANRVGVRSPMVYVILGLVIWGCFLSSGVHATVAGVLLAFTIPARTRIDGDAFLVNADRVVAAFRDYRADDSNILKNHGQQEALQELEDLTEAAQAPLQRIEHEIQTFVALGIIPVFALANAGVHLPEDPMGALQHPITVGVTAGLLLGKPIGITLFSWLAVRFGLAELPYGVTWRALHAVSWLGGIGFTMSLFISGLAFNDPALEERSKLGILLGSALAVVVGTALIRSLPRKPELADETPLEPPRLREDDHIRTRAG